MSPKFWIVKLKIFLFLINMRLNRILIIATFPGVIVHEWAHKTMCDLFNIKVYKVSYLSLKGNINGYVLHDEPQKYYQAFWISIGPLFLNSLLAIIFTFIALNFYSDNLLISSILFWIAFSIGLHAFPSSTDANNLLSFSKKCLKRWYNPLNLLHLLTFPLVFLFWIMNKLKYFGIDIVYAIFLIYITICFHLC